MKNLFPGAVVWVSMTMALVCNASARTLALQARYTCGAGERCDVVAMKLDALGNAQALVAVHLGGGSTSRVELRLLSCRADTRRCDVASEWPANSSAAENDIDMSVSPATVDILLRQGIGSPSLRIQSRGGRLSLNNPPVPGLARLADSTGVERTFLRSAGKGVSLVRLDAAGAELQSGPVLEA